MAGDLTNEFFRIDTECVAKQLLGCTLVHVVNGTRLSGTIVETEAYLGAEDLGCHSARGRTTRTEVMFGPPGHAYIYLIYGMYNCLNAVTRPEGEPEAVLIRAIEPVSGTDSMRTNRRSRRSGRIPTDENLTNGPGKLCAALAIDRALNGVSLLGEDLWIESGKIVPPHETASGPRIGIEYAEEWKEKPLRFWIRGNPFVSHPPDRRSG
jgi:DNA-3-methyladenine glycosylase